jgi:hypothetical protein
VHWDTPEDENVVGKGANIVTASEDRVWAAMISSKV